MPLGSRIKRVAQEDKAALESAGLKLSPSTPSWAASFKDDKEHQLFLLYPEGNWVELDEGAPYVMIGNSGQGKPILNRTLHDDSSMKQALKAGFLSLDFHPRHEQRRGITDQRAVLSDKKDSFSIVEHRFEEGPGEHIGAVGR